MTGIVATGTEFITTGLSIGTQSLRTASQSLDMLELYVRKAKLDQVDAHKAHRDTFRLELIEDQARERTRRQKALAAEVYADPQTKALYDANYARLSALFD